MARKLKYFDKILIVVGLMAMITFAVYVIVQKRPSYHYQIPEGFEGWVTIRYEKPDAPAPEEKDGAIIFKVPKSGILETNFRYESGWAKDEFFWYSPDGSVTAIPKAVEGEEELLRHIHSDEVSALDVTPILAVMPDNVDTTLWDGTRLSRRGNKVDVQSGRDVLQHFYVTAQPESFFFTHDSLPPARKEW